MLVHYKDAHAGNADAERWEDRVWVFEREGTGLRWTEYPIVVFDDESGRFERREHRSVRAHPHFWEPSEAQLADIRDGLQVNSRGSKTKTLRGSDAKGWSSGRRAGSASASVVSYRRSGRSRARRALPIFTRSDLMGSGRSRLARGHHRVHHGEGREGGLLRGELRARRQRAAATLPHAASGAVGAGEGRADPGRAPAEDLSARGRPGIARGEGMPGGDRWIRAKAPTGWTACAKPAWCRRSRARG